MAPAAELRVIDRHPTISGSTSQAATGNVVFDELLAHLAEIVAAKVIDSRGRRPPPTSGLTRAVPPSTSESTATAFVAWLLSE